MVRARVVLRDDAWAAVREAYEGNEETVAEILIRFGILRHQLYDRAERDRWRKRSVCSIRSVEDVPPPPSRLVPQPRAVPDADDDVRVLDEACEPSVHAARPALSHGERLERLYRILDRLLETMESNLVHSPNMSAQQHERAVKSVNATVTAMERLADIADPKKAPETSEGGKTNDSADAERMRREIAERLERLSAKLLDAPGKSE